MLHSHGNINVIRYSAEFGRILRPMKDSRLSLFSFVRSKYLPGRTKKYILKGNKTKQTQRNKKETKIDIRKPFQESGLATNSTNNSHFHIFLRKSKRLRFDRFNGII